MQNLMEHPYGWSMLDDQFITRIVRILSSPFSLINVCRPATAILKRLVEADPNHEPNIASSSGAAAATSSNARRRTYVPNSVYRYGFDVVFDQMRKEEAMLDTVVHRLSSPETAMTLNR
jgi:engulfment and cell motility protein 1